MNKKVAAPKKKVAAKKAAAPAKVAVKKATVPVKPAARKKVSKGESLACEICGLSVIVEEVGGIAVGQTNVLLCCGKPMKTKVKKAKATKKTK